MPHLLYVSELQLLSLTEKQTMLKAVKSVRLYVSGTWGSEALIVTTNTKNLGFLTMLFFVQGHPGLVFHAAMQKACCWGYEPGILIKKSSSPELCGIAHTASVCLAVTDVPFVSPEFYISFIVLGSFRMQYIRVCHVFPSQNLFFNEL